jgi:anti-anti-sigma regulatory factor
MFLATINKSKRLLHLSFIAKVRVEELAQAHDEVVGLIADLPRGFRLLSDLDRLDSMGADCAAEIARMMEVCDQKGVELIVRVVPDPSKDIGLGILSQFHYPHRPRMITCQSMAEAAEVLALTPTKA